MISSVRNSLQNSKLFYRIYVPDRFLSINLNIIIFMFFYNKLKWIYYFVGSSFNLNEIFRNLISSYNIYLVGDVNAQKN